MVAQWESNPNVEEEEEEEEAEWKTNVDDSYEHTLPLPFSFAENSKGEKGSFVQSTANPRDEGLNSTLD